MVTRLELNVDSAYVKKIRVWIGKNEDTSVRARPWVYNIKNGRPGKSLVKQSVVRKVPGGKTWMVFDMRKQSIKVHHDFFVGIEFLGGSKSHKDDPYSLQAKWRSWEKLANVLSSRGLETIS